MVKPRTLWIVAVVVAVLVEMAGLAGWWAWERVVDRLQTAPDDAARKIAEGGAVSAPAAVLRSRRFAASDMSQVDPARIVEALQALGQRQLRHMPIAPYGHLNLARSALTDGRLREGLEALKMALARDPTNPFALRLMGLLLRFQGRADEALDLLADAECVAPGFRLPPVELSAEDEEWVRLEGLRRRLEAYPRIRLETMVALSRALRSTGRIEEAREVLEQAQGDPHADLLHARWLLDEGDTAAAARIARTMVRRLDLPSSIRAEAWALIAAVLEYEGDTDGALAAAQRALNLAPSSAAPYVALARIAEGKGDLETALEHCRRAWGIDPTNLRVLSHIARVAEQAGQLADARLALERAVELQPDEPRVAAYLVDFHLRHGGYMEAALALSAALDRSPTDARLLSRAEILRREVTKR
jgi:tetratricopeptide (TPR) repeat protein